MPVLDSTFLVDLDREPERHRSWLETQVEEQEDLVVPAQAAIEFASGEHDPAAALRDLQASFWIVPVDERIQLEAARLARKAFEDGIFPGWADLQIAATASYLGMSIATRNRKHFEPLGLTVNLYRS